MESGTSLQSKVSSTPNTRSITTRRRPLHTCGVAVVTIAHKAYRRAENLNGPTGILTQKLAELLGPFLLAMHYQFLSILSSIDHHILTAEKRAESAFPPSVHLFNKIDTLVQASETVPDKFDGVLDRMLMTAQQITLLNWSCQIVSLVLNVLIMGLTDWGRVQVEAEKEIMIDANSHEDAVANEEAVESPTKDGSTSEGMGGGKKSFKEILFMDGNEEKYEEVGDVKKVQPTYKEVLEKKTYKEVLEKGTKKEEDGEEAIMGAEKKKVNEGGGNDDPILQLFASAWHMK